MSAASGEDSRGGKMSVMPDRKAGRKKIARRVLIGVGVFLVVVALLIALIIYATAKGWIFVGQAH